MTGRRSGLRPDVGTLNYEIILYWSDEDGACVAEVPELPGCIAHGDTQEVALANAKEPSGALAEDAALSSTSGKRSVEYMHHV